MTSSRRGPVADAAGRLDHDPAPRGVEHRLDLFLGRAFAGKAGRGLDKSAPASHRTLDGARDLVQGQVRGLENHLDQHAGRFGPRRHAANVLDHLTSHMAERTSQS